MAYITIAWQFDGYAESPDVSRNACSCWHNLSPLSYLIKQSPRVACISSIYIRVMNAYHQVLRDALIPLLQEYAYRISLFGSVARNEHTKDSDIDVLVALKDASSRPGLGLKWFEIEHELSQILGRTVELVTENALNPRLAPYIAADLVVLYEEG